MDEDRFVVNTIPFAILPEMIIMFYSVVKKSKKLPGIQNLSGVAYL
jgi:hypothetical protein